MTDPHFPTNASELSALARALESASPEPRPACGLGRLRVPVLHAGPLHAFPQGPAADAADLRASVLLRAAEPAGGLFVLSFDPEDALSLLAREGPPPRSPAEAIERLGRSASGWIDRLARPLGRKLPAGATGRVVEDTLVGAVLSAHPPPDTRVLCAALRWPEAGIDAVWLWLAPDKTLGRALAGSGEPADGAAAEDVRSARR